MQQKKRWYQKTLWIIVSLFVFFPVGLFLMWKYSNWSKKTKTITTTLILVVGLVVLAVDSMINETSQQSTLTFNKVETTATTNVKEIENPKQTIEELIIDTVKPNGEVSINGPVLYIKSLENASNKKSYQQSIAKTTYKKIFDIIDEIPSEITTVCVWHNGIFLDTYGNENEQTIYRLNIEIETLKNINWDNYLLIDFEELTNGDMLVSGALK